MKSYLTELIGTLFLVLTIGLTVIGGTDFAPLAIGSTLMIMVSSVPCGKFVACLAGPSRRSRRCTSST